MTGTSAIVTPLSLEKGFTVVITGHGIQLQLVTQKYKTHLLIAHWIRQRKVSGEYFSEIFFFFFKPPNSLFYITFLLPFLKKKKKNIVKLIWTHKYIFFNINCFLCILWTIELSLNTQTHLVGDERSSGWTSQAHFPACMPIRHSEWWRVQERDTQWWCFPLICELVLHLIVHSENSTLLHEKNRYSWIDYMNKEKRAWPCLCMVNEDKVLYKKQKWAKK